MRVSRHIFANLFKEMRMNIAYMAHIIWVETYAKKWRPKIWECSMPLLDFTPAIISLKLSIISIIARNSFLSRRKPSTFWTKLSKTQDMHAKTAASTQRVILGRLHSSKGLKDWSTIYNNKLYLGYTAGLYHR